MESAWGLTVEVDTRKFKVNSMSTTPTPSPRNVPNPGQLARKKPGAAGTTPRITPTPGTIAAATATPAQDPKKFGRVDAEGRIFLITADGEREIAQWKAGSPEEGLAHYAERFTDLVTDVALLENRLSAHPGDAAQLRESARTLLAELPTAAVIGDVASLRARLEKFIATSESAEEKAQEDKAAARAAAIARKEAIIAEANDIAENSTQWKEAGNRMSALLDEWRTIRGVPKKQDDELWKQYSRARDAFNRRRGSHFADLDKQRAHAKKRKEELIAEAEALQDSTDWGETARAMSALMREWKKSGRAPREVDNELWKRFKAAQDTFFAARHADAAARDAEFEDNAQAKDALLAEYEPQINPETNLEQARTKLNELREKWEEIGYVPRNKVREYEDKISRVEKQVSDAEKSQWRRTDPEAQARADQFTVRAQELRSQADEAEAKGKTKKAADLRAQAEQWEQWSQAAHSAIEDR